MTDYNTLQKRRNVIVGGFVIIASAALIWLIALFGDLPVTVSEFRSFKIVIQFPTASGVQEQTPVRYCGYQVGRVTEVLPPMPVSDWEEGSQTHVVRIGLAIDKKFKSIPDNVTIKVMTRSIGSSYIEIFDPEKPSGTFLREGMDYLHGGAGSTNEFIPKEIQQKLEVLVERVSSLAASVDQIVGDKENQVNFKQTLANFIEMSAQATVMLKSVEKFSIQATNTLKSVEKLSTQGQTSLHETSEALVEAIKEIESILAKVNNGEGTIGRLVNDGLLYENLVESSEELRMALEQLKILAEQVQEKGLKSIL
ncbi:MAG: MCE family protein [Planctomycetes bacterium]|nr:MCE family protein [Planctomycetota bacterium]